MSTLANGNWLTRDRIRRVAVVCALGSLVLLAWLIMTSHGALDWRGRPLGTDFSEVWAAGKMALEGRAPEVWNWQQHFAMQEAVQGPGLTQFYAWHYPPPFLLIASVLALMRYLPALVVWQLATLAPFAWLMQRLVPGRDTIILTLAAPATMLCLTHGANGFLTALLLGGGLALIERRPVLAGMLIGCLIYKPHLGLILPIMLLAGRHWKAISGAFVSAAALVGLTVAVWGWPVWEAFIGSLPLTRAVIVENGVTGFYRIMSPFAAVRLWGGSIPAAYLVQLVFTLSAVVAVAAVSRSTALPELRNSLVCAAAVIATPYVIDYDLVILLPALAWLYLDGRRYGFLNWDATLMAFVWIAPLFARPAAQFAYMPLGLFSALCVAFIAIRRFRQVRDGDRSRSPASKGAGKEATAPC